MKKGKAVLASASMCFICSATQAGVFVGPTTNTNRFVVATNDAVIFTALKNVGGSAQIIQDTVTNYLEGINMTEKPGSMALAGPAEIVFANTVIVSYQLLRGSLIRSCILSPRGRDSNIDVPSGKTIHFFAPLSLGNIGDYPLTIQKDDLTISNLTINAGEEYSGPLHVKLSAATVPQVISYYLTDDFVAAPEQAVLQVSPGRLSFTILKSVDLENWYPVVELPSANDQEAFYRLGILK